MTLLTAFCCSLIGTTYLTNHVKNKHKIKSAPAEGA